MKSIKSQSLLTKSIFLLWVIICFGLFLRYAGIVSFIHIYNFEDTGVFFKGLSRINFQNFFFDMITALFGVLLFTLSCTAFGAFLLDFLGSGLKKDTNTTLSFLAYLGTAFLVGEIVISSAFLLLGSFHLLSAPIVISAMIVMSLVGARAFIRMLVNLSIKVNKDYVNSTSRFDRFLFGASIAILLLTLLYSSSRLGYDAVGMYFSDAKIIAMTERIQFFSDVFVVGSLHTGIQYAAIIQVFGDQAARMYSWIGGLLILVFAVAIGQKVGVSKKVLLLWQIMILTSTVFIDLMGDGKIDLQTTAPTTAAIYWMLVKKRSESDHWAYFLIGILAGFSIISRLFNAFLLFVFAGLFYFWQMYSQRKNGRWDVSLLLKPTLGIGAGVLVLVGFHLIANQIIMGDALAPLKTLSTVNSSVWHYPYDPKDIWIYRLLYPFVVTFINSPQSGGNISPVFVVSVPLLFWVVVRKKIKFSEDIIVISIIAIVTLVLWVTLFYMIMEIRYVLFLWVILFLPASIILEKVLQIDDRVFTSVLKFFLAVLLIFIMVRVLFISISTYSPVDDSNSPLCYDASLCEFIRPLNQVSPIGERVLALNAYRYYMRPDLFACSSKSDDYILLQKAFLGGINSFWGEVYRQGYKFVVYEENFTKKHLLIDLTPNPEETPSWITLEPISGVSGHNLVVYRLIAIKAPFKPEKTCNEVSPGLWLVELLP